MSNPAPHADILPEKLALNVLAAVLAGTVVFLVTVGIVLF